MSGYLSIAAAGVLLVGALAGPAWAAHARHPGATKSQGRGYVVTIANMAYGALPPKLKAGDTVTFVNADIFRHSVTARDGSFDLDLKPKARGSVVLKKPGVTAFFCRYHPGMTGRLAATP